MNVLGMLGIPPHTPHTNKKVWKERKFPTPVSTLLNFKFKKTAFKPDRLILNFPVW